MVPIGMLLSLHNHFSMTTSQLTKKIQYLEKELMLLRQQVWSLPALQNRQATALAETRGSISPARAKQMLRKITQGRKQMDRRLHRT